MDDWKINFKPADRIEMARYSMNPDIPISQQGNFYPSKILEEIKSGKKVILTEGLTIEDHSSFYSRTVLQQPFLLYTTNNNEGNNFIGIMPFRPKIGDSPNKFIINMEKLNVTADKDYIRIKNNCNYKDDKFRCVNIEPIWSNEGPYIAISNRLEKSEVHKVFLEEVASTFGLEFGNYEENQWTFYQWFMKNGIEFKIGAEKRKGKHNWDMPKDIKVVVDENNSELINKLEKLIKLDLTISHWEKDQFEIDSTFYQVAKLEKVINTITNKQ